MTQLEHIQAELKRSISFFYEKRNHNRSMTVTLGVASASLSAAATVAIGSSKMLSIGWLGVLAMVATGIATVMGVYESIFSYKRLWSINNEALAALEKLQREIAFRVLEAREVTKKEIDEYFERLESALAGADKAWVKTYTPKT